MGTNSERLLTWTKALSAYDVRDLDTALDRLVSIPDPSSYLLYNLGIVYSAKDRLKEASLCMREAVEMDERFHLGFYRLGCLSYEMKQYDEAIHWFERSEACFRENKLIDYEQLGLKYRLALWQVIYNSALAWGMTGNMSKSIELLLQARTDKGSKPDDVIERTLRALQQPPPDFSQFSMILPKEDLLFRPHASLQIAKKINWLGKAEVIAENKQEKLPEPNQKDCSDVIKPLKFPDILTDFEIPPPPNDPPPRSSSIQGSLEKYKSDMNIVKSPPMSPPPRCT